MYEVVSQPNKDIPVFVVRDNEGMEKTLHRNHVLPVGSRDEPIMDRSRPVPKPRRFSKEVKSYDSDLSKKCQTKRETLTQLNIGGTTEVKSYRYEESSDSESDVEYINMYSRDNRTGQENRN